MDNTKVRQYLLKGEKAVTLLESLGYTYKFNTLGPSEWITPAKEDPLKALSEKAHDELLKPLLDRFQELLTVPASECPVNIGTKFTIARLPDSHFLKGYRLPQSRVYQVEEIKRVKAGSPQADHLGFVGLAISFDVVTGFSERRLWLPLDCIKVTADARF